MAGEGLKGARRKTSSSDKEANGNDREDHKRYSNKLRSCSCLGCLIVAGNEQLVLITKLITPIQSLNRSMACKDVPAIAKANRGIDQLRELVGP